MGTIQPAVSLDERFQMTNIRLPRRSGDATAVDALQRVCAAYSAYLRCPVTVDQATQRVVVIAGDDLDAITMPEELGRSVWTALAAKLVAGPTIVGPGPHRWTILTQRAERERVACSRELHLARVNVIPRGAQIVLPSHRDTTQTWSWIEPPRPSLRLPTWSAVMTIAAHMLADESVHREAS